jgi:plasmid stabilization system protein ParE
MKFLSRVSPNAAIKQKKQIVSNISYLESNPYRYPVYDADPDLPEHRKMVIGRYIILYVVSEEDKTVNVDLVWDSRMDNVL